MARQSLTLANLKDFAGGAVQFAFDNAVRRIHEDIRDRPGLKTARKIKLEVTFTPNVHQDQSVLTGAGVQCKVTEALPLRQTEVNDTSITEMGFLFEGQSPQDANQMPLSDAIPAHDPDTGEVLGE